MSYHGKLQVLKNGTADKEIQLWAYHQLEKEQAELTDEEIDVLVHEYNCIDDYPYEFVRACIRKAQEK